MNAGIYGGIVGAGIASQELNKHYDHHGYDYWSEYYLVESWLNEKETLDEKLALCYQLSHLKFRSININNAVKAHIDRLIFEREKQHFENKFKPNYFTII